MHTKVHAVRENIRYRVLEIDNHYYLVDIEENLLFYFIPFLTWFHTYKIYVIDEALAKGFIERSKEEKEKGKKRKVQTAVLLPIALTLSIVFGRILIGMGFNDLVFFQGIAINIVTLTLTVIAIGYFWRTMYKRGIEKINHLLINQSIITNLSCQILSQKEKRIFSDVFLWDLFIILYNWNSCVTFD